MHWTPRREVFRAYLERESCFHPGSVFDPISARIAEELGFEAGIFAGSVASLAVLGAPDLIVLTLSEFAQQAHRFNRAGNLPLLVDADHGYGNALNVRRTVEELETAGVAALTIEDTDLPQPFGTVGATRVLPIEEGVGKMKAGLSGRQDSSLVIAGRTSAASITAALRVSTRPRPCIIRLAPPCAPTCRCCSAPTARSVSADTGRSHELRCRPAAMIAHCASV